MLAPPPPPSLGALTWRFLCLGASAFGGPVVQIARLHDEFVVRQGRIDDTRFHRALALYQALPGPEATEMCIWVGATLRGRLGGLLAGLAFVLPGLTLMLLACALWFDAPPWPASCVAALRGMQCGAAALVVRATWRLGRAVLQRRANAWASAGLALVGALGHVPFAVALLGGGLVGIAATRRGSPTLAGTSPIGRSARTTTAIAFVAWSAAALLCVLVFPPNTLPTTTEASARAMPWLGGVGLRAGLLTFGGAYTAIPFLQADACGPGGWLDEATFASGLAIGSVLPAPMVVVGAWVGWAGDGVRGALLVCGGIFLPAFALPLLLHTRLERWLAARGLHALLDGVAAAVVGLIAATAVQLVAARVAPEQLGITAIALWCGSRRSRFAAALAMAVSGALGAVLG